MSTLLARYAECIFWMARYMERAENLARILDVNESFNRDGSGGRDWLPLVRLNADEQRFFERHQLASDRNVAHFYVLDTQNTTSILSSVRAARENARTLRPWISTEMWTHLNVLHNHLLELGPQDVEPQNLSRLCARIKEDCQAHGGITEGTFYRDQGWSFYQLGRYVERADQTTRLLDIEYHTLLKSADQAYAPADFTQWASVLRSAAGYHAFRRVYPRGITPAEVAGFMLFNKSYPRSVALCVDELHAHLRRLKFNYQLKGGNEVMEQVDQIHSTLQTRTIESVIRLGLHEFLDGLQLRLIEITNGLGMAFFGQGDIAA